MAEIINYCISIMLMLFALITFKKKARRTPDFKLLGMEFEKFEKLIYIGIGVFMILILNAIFN